MTYTYYPFDSGAGSTVSQAQWQAMQKLIVGDGVARGVQNALAVAAPGGMNVSVDTGTAFLVGTYFNNSALATLAISAADPSLARLDLVVVHADLTAHTVDARVLTGTPSASPVAPTVTQSASVWEIALAQVAVAAAASSVASGNITDLRGYAGAPQLAPGASHYLNAADANDVLGLNVHGGTAAMISLESKAKQVMVSSGTTATILGFNVYFDGSNDRFMGTAGNAEQLRLSSGILQVRTSTNTVAKDAAITWGNLRTVWDTGTLVTQLTDPGVANFPEGGTWIQGRWANDLAAMFGREARSAQSSYELQTSARGPRLSSALDGNDLMGAW